MIIFLPKDIWKNKRGIPFKKPVNYLKVGYHTGQDSFTSPVGKIPVIAPCDGFLKTFPFSRDAGWWGYYEFNYKNKIYSLKILHMYKQMKDGEYKKEDVLGYCGATGLSLTKKYGICYIGKSHEEQTSDKAAPHLHVELHKGKFEHDTNRNKLLADERIIDPVINFEKWVGEYKLINNSVKETKIIEIPEKIIQTNKRQSNNKWFILLKWIIDKFLNKK